MSSPADRAIGTGFAVDVTERDCSREQLAYLLPLLDHIEDGVIATDAEDFRITDWNRGAERLYGFTAEEVLGRPAGEVGTFPGDVARRKLEAELRGAGRTRIEFEARHKDGSSVEVELIAVAVEDERSEITGYLWIHRDIGERRRTERQLELRIRQQAAVAQLGLRALVDGGLQPLMDEAAASVCRGLGIEYAKVDELLPEGKGLLVRAGAGWGEGIIGSCVMPAGRGSPAGHALMYGQPVIVEDMTTEARFDVPGVLHEHRVISDVTVVIDPCGKPFGTLAALSTRPRRFAEHDIDFVQSVAYVLASAIERARARESLEAACEAERGRIARELHDDALRELTDALALAAMARSSAATPRDEQRWRDVTQGLKRAARQLRAAVYDLRLSPAEARAFTDLLEELVATQADVAMGCKIELHGLEALPAASLGDRGAEVLRIVREAITNARLHSGATMIEVDAGESRGDMIRIDVSDDGQWPGREPAVSERVGAGIVGMFDRADQIGAELRIQGRRGGGTGVSLEVP